LSSAPGSGCELAMPAGPGELHLLGPVSGAGAASLGGGLAQLPGVLPGLLVSLGHASCPLPPSVLACSRVGLGPWGDVPGHSHSDQPQRGLTHRRQPSW
jgi:hypothetical protein